MIHASRASGKEGRKGSLGKFWTMEEAAALCRVNGGTVKFWTPKRKIRSAKLCRPSFADVALAKGLQSQKSQT